ncbi:hypothetical protein NL676_008294 [Syzygium grande]|nr:hypothetical protein NL676_008294 [Syzygium grande]
MSARERLIVRLIHWCEFPVEILFDQSVIVVANARRHESRNSGDRLGLRTNGASGPSSMLVVHNKSEAVPHLPISK